MTLARIAALVPLAVVACGTVIELGDRHAVDGGATVDFGPTTDAATTDAATTDAVATGTSCGADTVRRNCQVFLTDARTQADFGGLAGADARCNVAAEGAGLTGRFKAYLSDGAIAAWSRFVGSGPWVLVGSGETVFGSAAQLKVDGPHPLNRNERGEELSITGHWTGVREQGFGGAACSGFTSLSHSLRGSFGNTAPSRWLFQADVTCDTEVGFHLLCLED